MKKIFVASLLFFSVSSFAQLQVNHLGLNLNFNSSYSVPNDLINTFFVLPSVTSPGSPRDVSVSRVCSDYKIGFNTTKYKFLQFEADILQGVEFIYYSDYEYNISDSIFSRNTSTDIESSLIGLRTMAKVSTDLERRFIFNFGLGVEGLFLYDLDKDGQIRIKERTSNIFGTKNEYIAQRSTNNYGNVNLAQQAGMSFRLGKDETKYPFNKVLIETNFQIISNFTIAAGELYRYRTYGGIIGLTYEFR